LKEREARQLEKGALLLKEEVERAKARKWPANARSLATVRTLLAREQGTGGENLRLATAGGEGSSTAELFSYDAMTGKRIFADARLQWSPIGRLNNLNQRVVGMVQANQMTPLRCKKLGDEFLLVLIMVWDKHPQLTPQRVIQCQHAHAMGWRAVICSNSESKSAAQWEKTLTEGAMAMYKARKTWSINALRTVLKQGRQRAQQQLTSPAPAGLHEKLLKRAEKEVLRRAEQAKSRQIGEIHAIVQKERDEREQQLQEQQEQEQEEQRRAQEYAEAWGDSSGAIVPAGNFVLGSSGGKTASAGAGRGVAGRGHDARSGREVAGGGCNGASAASAASANQHTGDNADGGAPQRHRKYHRKRRRRHTHREGGEWGRSTPKAAGERGASAKGGRGAGNRAAHGSGYRGRGGSGALPCAVTIQIQEDVKKILMPKGEAGGTDREREKHPLDEYEVDGMGGWGEDGEADGEGGRGGGLTDEEAEEAEEAEDEGWDDAQEWEGFDGDGLDEFDERRSRSPQMPLTRGDAEMGGMRDMGEMGGSETGDEALAARIMRLKREVYDVIEQEEVNYEKTPVGGGGQEGGQDESQEEEEEEEEEQQQQEEEEEQLLARLHEEANGIKARAREDVEDATDVAMMVLQRASRRGALRAAGAHGATGRRSGGTRRAHGGRTSGRTVHRHGENRRTPDGQHRGTGSRPCAGSGGAGRAGRPSTAQASASKRHARPLSGVGTGSRRPATAPNTRRRPATAPAKRSPEQAGNDDYGSSGDYGDGEGMGNEGEGSSASKLVMLVIPLEKKMLQIVHTLRTELQEASTACKIKSLEARLSAGTRKKPDLSRKKPQLPRAKRQPARGGEMQPQPRPELDSRLVSRPVYGPENSVTVSPCTESTESTESTEGGRDEGGGNAGGIVENENEQPEMEEPQVMDLECPLKLGGRGTLLQTPHEGQARQTPHDGQAIQPTLEHRALPLTDFPEELSAIPTIAAALSGNQCTDFGVRRTLTRPRNDSGSRAGGRLVACKCRAYKLVALVMGAPDERPYHEGLVLDGSEPMGVQNDSDGRGKSVGRSVGRSVRGHDEQSCVGTGARFMSIFDGATQYHLGVACSRRFDPARQRGLHVCATADDATRQMFPPDSKLLLAQRVVLEVEVWGEYVQFPPSSESESRFMFSHMRPIGVHESVVPFMALEKIYSLAGVVASTSGSSTSASISDEQQPNPGNSAPSESLRAWTAVMNGLSERLVRLWRARKLTPAAAKLAGDEALVCFAELVHAHRQLAPEMLERGLQGAGADRALVGGETLAVGALAATIRAWEPDQTTMAWEAALLEAAREMRKQPDRSWNLRFIRHQAPLLCMAEREVCRREATAMAAARRRRQLELAPEFVALHDRDDAAISDREVKHAAATAALANAQAYLAADIESVAAEQQAATTALADAMATAEARATDDRHQQRQELEAGLGLDGRRQLGETRLRQAALIDALAWVADLAREFSTATAAEREASGAVHEAQTGTGDAETEQGGSRNSANKRWHWEQQKVAELESTVAGFEVRYSEEVRALVEHALKGIAAANDVTAVLAVEVEVENQLMVIHTRMHAEVAMAQLEARKAKARCEQLESRKTVACATVQRQALTAGVRLQTMVVAAAAAARAVDRALDADEGKAKFSALVVHIANKWATRAKREVEFAQKAGGDGDDAALAGGALFLEGFQDEAGGSDDGGSDGETESEVPVRVPEEEGAMLVPRKVSPQLPQKPPAQQTSKEALEALVQVQVTNIGKVCGEVMHGISLVALKSSKRKHKEGSRPEGGGEEGVDQINRVDRRDDLAELDVTNQLAVLDQTLGRAVARAETEVAKAVAEIEARAWEAEEQAESRRMAKEAAKEREERERWWQQVETEKRATAERTEAQLLLLQEQQQLRLVEARQVEAEVEATRREAEYTQSMAAASSEREAIEAKVATMATELRASKGGVKWLVEAERQRRQREADVAQSRIDAVYATVGRLRALMRMDDEDCTNRDITRLPKRLRWLLRRRAQPQGEGGTPSHTSTTGAGTTVEALPELPAHPPALPPGEAAPEEAHERAMRDAYEAVIRLGSIRDKRKGLMARRKCQGMLLTDLQTLARLEPEELQRIDMHGNSLSLGASMAKSEEEAAALAAAADAAGIEPGGLIRTVLVKTCMQRSTSGPFAFQTQTHFGNTEERALATRLLQVLASNTKVRARRRVARAKAQAPKTGQGSWSPDASLVLA
jgi:hypothetical protein